MKILSESQIIPYCFADQVLKAVNHVIEEEEKVRMCTKKQARKLGRCDNYLRNLKLSLTGPLTDYPLTGVGARRPKNLSIFHFACSGGGGY